jgi:hypothetical protein
MGEDPGDNDPKDFCRKCFPEAKEQYADDPLAEIEDDHPPYDETDHRCEICGKILTLRDN